MISVGVRYSCFVARVTSHESFPCARMPYALVLLCSCVLVPYALVPYALVPLPSYHLCPSPTGHEFVWREFPVLVRKSIKTEVNGWNSLLLSEIQRHDGLSNIGFQSLESG